MFSYVKPVRQNAFQLTQGLWAGSAAGPDAQQDQRLSLQALLPHFARLLFLPTAHQGPSPLTTRSRSVPGGKQPPSPAPSIGASSPALWLEVPSSGQSQYPAQDYREEHEWHLRPGPWWLLARHQVALETGCVSVHSSEASVVILLSHYSFEFELTSLPHMTS